MNKPNTLSVKTSYFESKRFFEILKPLGLIAAVLVLYMFFVKDNDTLKHFIIALFLGLLGIDFFTYQFSRGKYFFTNNGVEFEINKTDNGGTRSKKVRIDEIKNISLNQYGHFGFLQHNKMSFVLHKKNKILGVEYNQEIEICDLNHFSSENRKEILTFFNISNPL